MLQTPVPRPAVRSVVTTALSLPLMSKISKISVLQQGQDIVEVNSCPLPVDFDMHDLDNYADIIYNTQLSSDHSFAFQPP